MRTLAQLREEVLDWLDEGGDTDTTKTLVDNSLNQANALRASQQRWPWMLSSIKTFSTVAGQTDYVLDERATKLDFLYNQTTKAFLTELSDGEIVSAKLGFGDVDVTSAQYFSIVGTSPVKTFISTAGTLTVTSSTAETGATLYIEGEDASGNILSEELTPGGSASSGTYKVVSYVAKRGTWAGTLTLTLAGATTLLVLSPTQYAKQHPVIRLLNPPTSVETLSYRWTRKPRRMEYDHDTPDIPEPNEQILVWDALLMLSAYTEQDSEATGLWHKYQEKWELNLLTTMFVGDSTNGMGESVKYIEQ
jgi:hypothetical protein